MRRIILIPTDFSIESLNVLMSVLNNSNDNDVFDIILLHGAHLTSSITELLYFSKGAFIDSLSNPEFDEACAIIKNKFASQINSVRKELFTGHNQAAFNNFVEANKIDEAYIASNFSLNLDPKKSFDLTPFLERSTLAVDEVEWKFENQSYEKGNLAELFVNSMASN